MKYWILAMSLFIFGCSSGESGDSPDEEGATVGQDVADTLNYKRVAKRIQSFVGESSFQLVETLAERIAGIIRDEFDVAWCRVKVHKPGAIRGSKDVGVEIERGEMPG